MDRTAIAAIIIGLGATVAAMVMPLKYPKAPKWAIDLSWWGGLSLIVAGGLYLVTEFTVSDLGSPLAAAFDQASGYIAALLRLPIFWVVVAFAGGIAAHRWFPSLWKTLPAIRPAGPRVTEWLTPVQAVERFVDPELLSKDQLAQDKASQFREKAESLETELAGAVDPEKAVTLRDHLASTIKERDDADYIAKRRRTDVIDYLKPLFKSGRIVGKGRKMKKKKGHFIAEQETLIPANFWTITVENEDVLRLEKGIAWGYLGVYRDVLIGKNEDFKTPLYEAHPGLMISHPNKS
jgi:hypothetical protein